MVPDATTISPDRCTAESSATTAIESWPAREARLGAFEIRRALPVREKRLVGPWCFLDRYGPVSFSEGKPMDLAPHPHIGLQTVSWLLEGEILHRDSLDSEVVIRPGQLNLMTSGDGIAHTEETPRKNSGKLSGVQLWIALPDETRRGAPGFEHHPDLPAFDPGDGELTVIMGSIGDTVSQATAHSPLVAAELRAGRNERSTIPLRRDFEHAVFVLDGAASLEGQRIVPDVLYYLSAGRDELCIESLGARILILGGEPFPHEVLMWWNFVARTPEEIAQAREDWAAGRRFGEVRGYEGPPMDAPPLRGRVSPPPAS